MLDHLGATNEREAERKSLYPEHRAKLFFQSGVRFESKYPAVGTFHLPALIDPGSTQSRNTNTLRRDAKPSDQVAVRQRHQ